MRKSGTDGYKVLLLWDESAGKGMKESIYGHGFEKGREYFCSKKEREITDKRISDPFFLFPTVVMVRRWTGGARHWRKKAKKPPGLK